MKNNNTKIYKWIIKLLARIKIDYNKYYNKKKSEEEGWYYGKYIFFHNIKIEITDWKDWIFIKVDWKEIKWSPFNYIESIQAEDLAPYLVKILLKDLKQSEYERMSISWQKILNKILERKITDIKNEEDIEDLWIDYDRISPDWQETLDIIHDNFNKINYVD